MFESIIEGAYMVRPTASPRCIKNSPAPSILVFKVKPPFQEFISCIYFQFVVKRYKYQG